MCATLGRLHSHSLEGPSAPNFRLLAYAVILGAIVLVAGIWVLNDGTIAEA
jgi:putative membrane protein